MHLLSCMLPKLQQLTIMHLGDANVAAVMHALRMMSARPHSVRLPFCNYAYFNPRKVQDFIIECSMLHIECHVFTA